MNPVLIVVIIVLALLGIKGAFKGLFKILFSIVTLIACILIAGVIAVPVANGLKANTGMYEGIDGFVYDTVKDNKNLNNKIIQYGQRTDVSLGTTFTGMLFCDDQYLICHVGDTRAYYIGIRIPSDFIVGYGLDYDEMGRAYRNIYKIIDN